jgi:hypothetical protein
MRDLLRKTEDVGRAASVARDPQDFERAFSTMATAAALIVFPSPMFYAEHRRLVDLVAKRRLPTVFALK